MSSSSQIISTLDRHFSKQTHPYGGTLVWGVQTKPTILNPILTTHSISMSLLDLIFNRLVRVNAKGQIEPDLAKSWDVSADGLVYTFHLTAGVKFHDGVECTAQDVEFTYQQIINPQNKSPFRSNFILVKEFKALGKYTFQITLERPLPDFLSKLVRDIVPKHKLVGQDLAKTSFNYFPVGTGAFKFKQWDSKTDRIELVANTDYFEGRPYLDNIVIQTYPNLEFLWTALMRHEVDLAEFINPEDYAVLTQDASFKTYTVDWGMYCAIVYNLRDSILADPDVRKAIAYGLDTGKMIKDFFPGGKESLGPFDQNVISIKPFQYDPVKAKMELMHRGWLDVDNDGILEKYRRKLEIKMLVDQRSELYQKIAAVVRQQFAQIGIKLTVVLYQEEAELTKEFLETNKPQAWLRFLTGLKYNEDAAEFVRSWYSLSTEFGKLWPYENQEVDQLFQLAENMNDADRRRDIYKKVSRIIYEDQPASFLFYPASLFAISTKFENTDEYFTRFMPTYTIKNWHASQKDQNQKGGEAHGSYSFRE